MANTTLPQSQPRTNVFDLVTAPVRYCPCCGQAMRTALQPGFMRPDYWLITCENERCVLFAATVSEGSAQSAAYLARWHTEQRYDIYTGEELQ